MLLTSRPAVGLAGFVVPPAGQRAGEDLAEHRQAVALVAADRQQRARRRTVEHRRVLVGPPLAVDRAAGRQRFAAVACDLDLAFGDRRRRDVEHHRRAVGTGRAGGNRVRRKPPVGAAVRRDEDAEARRVDEVHARPVRLAPPAPPTRRCGRDVRRCGSRSRTSPIAAPWRSQDPSLRGRSPGHSRTARRRRRCMPFRERRSACRLASTMPRACQSRYFGTRMTPCESWPARLASTRWSPTMRRFRGIRPGRAKHRRDERAQLGDRDSGSRRVRSSARSISAASCGP